MKQVRLILLVVALLLSGQCGAFASAIGFPQKAEDAASASGDNLMPVAGVRNDANDTALTGTDGDYTVLTTNAVGNLKVQLEPTRKPTYICDSGAFTCAASATDVSQIYPGGSKVVKVLKVFAIPYDTGSAVVSNTLNLIRRSTANSSGTPVTDTICPLDPGSSAANAVVKHYTANPTLGTSVATIAVNYQCSYSGGSAYEQPGQPLITLFDAATYGQPITLRASTDGLCVNLNGATQAGTSPKMIIRYVWTEE